MSHKLNQGFGDEMMTMLLNKMGKRLHYPWRYINPHMNLVFYVSLRMCDISYGYYVANEPITLPCICWVLRSITFRNFD